MANEPPAAGMRASASPARGSTSNPWRRAFRRILRSPMACVGLGIIITFVAVAGLADLIAPHAPGTIVTSRDETPPTPPREGHLLGTDSLGRDILSRLIHGSRISLMVGIVAESIALTIGILIGGIAGYFGGRMDGALMRLTDLVFSMPVALIAIVILGTFPEPDKVPLLRALPYPSLAVIFLVLGFLNWPSAARLVRGQVLAVRETDFTTAARALGASDSRVLFLHVLPNCLAPILVAGTIGVAGNILTEAWLSFLGLGAKPPLPSWGSMITDGQPYLVNRPWVCLAPGLAILVTVLGFNLLGDGLRDALDPRLSAGKKV